MAAQSTANAAAAGHTEDTDTQFTNAQVVAAAIAGGFVVGADTVVGGCGISIGDTYQGGIIFYLDASGCHGLISAPTDQSLGIRWYNGIYVAPGASFEGVKAGQSNTKLIVDTQGAGSYAAQLCDDLVIYSNDGLFEDWYLPSKYELNLMYVNLHSQGLGGFSNNHYWSSTEVNSALAWYQFFFSGNAGANDKYWTYYVRAIRAF